MTSKQEDITIHISTQSVVKAILVVLLFVVFFLLRDLFLVVLTSVIISASIEPIARWFIKRKIPRVPAVLGIYVGLAVLISVIFYFLLLPLLNEVSQFLSSLPSYLETVDLWNASDSFIGRQPVIQGIQESVSLSEVVGTLNKTISSASGGALSAISFVFGGIFSFLLMIVLSFYLCVQEKGIQRFLSMVTPFKHRNYVLDLWDRSETKIGLWFQGQLLLVVLIGVLTYLGLLLLRVEHSLLLASLAGIFELIPLFGPLLAAIPAIAIAFTTGDPTLALLVMGLYLIIQHYLLKHRERFLPMLLGLLQIY